MENGWWHWWTQTDAGLMVRISLGVLAFLILAIWDLRRKGAAAQRWREYLLLLAAVGVAMAYGVINDQITVGISWEYFYWGKGLNEVLGSNTPPENMALRWEAVKVGLKATWSVGLIFGVIVLFANNPRKNLPRVPYRTLYRLLPIPVAAAVIMGITLGLAGYFGWLTNWSQGFRELVVYDAFRPRTFMAVYGVHLGGYIGSALGAAGVVAFILRRRKKLAQLDAGAAEPK